MSAIRAMVFDIYKTLLDIETDEVSLEPYVFLSRWLSYHGVVIGPLSLRLRYLELCREETARCRGLYPEFNIEKVFAKILLDGKHANFDAESKSREMALLFRIATTKSISLYPGVFELLCTMKGKARLGIVSNAQRVFTMPELAKFDLIDFFDAIVLSSDAGVRKPAPEIFHRLLDTLAVPPEAAVFIGDNIFDDVYGAGKIGMKTIWIRWDSKPIDAESVGRARPDHEIRGGSYDGLSTILLSMID